MSLVSPDALHRAAEAVSWTGARSYRPLRARSPARVVCVVVTPAWSAAARGQTGQHHPAIGGPRRPGLETGSLLLGLAWPLALGAQAVWPFRPAAPPPRRAPAREADTP